MNRQEYTAYVAAFESGCKGLSAMSSGACPGCDDCGLALDCSEHDRELAGEGSFSWARCEICRRAEGGTREPIHAILDGKLVHLSACVDCVYFLEYGKLDDSTMLDIEDSDLAFVRSYGYDLLPRDPARNAEHAGQFMDCDKEDATGFCIVGDDRAELLRELVEHVAGMSNAELADAIDNKGENDAFVHMLLPRGWTVCGATAGEKRANIEDVNCEDCIAGHDAFLAEHADD